jgi:hypothetical protein
MVATRAIGARLALGLVAAVLVVGCGGGGGQSLDSIASCLKSKQFTVKRSGPNHQLKSLGFLTVNDDNLDVLMTVEVFQDTKAAKFSYDYSRSTHEKATINGKVVLTGDKKGPNAKKFDSCIS